VVLAQLVLQVGPLDQAIDSVVQTDSSGATTTDVYLSRRAEMVAPVELLIVGADSSTRSVKLPVQVWYGEPPYVYRLRTRNAARPIRLVIDSRAVYPDIDRTNNSSTSRR
jgi:hypothetical protein